MQGRCHNALVVADAASAAHSGAKRWATLPRRDRRTSLGSAAQATQVYLAGNDGGAGGVTGGDGVTAGGTGAGVVTHPAITASTAAASAARRVNGRRRREAMGWFLLEALLALVIAVAIVMWTMGPGAQQAAARIDERHR